MTTKRLVLDAVFAALTIILYCFVKFPLPFIFPSFLELNFSMLPILLCLFMLSWKDAAIVAILRILGKYAIVGSSTMNVGELADLLMSFIVLIIVALVYKKSQNIFVLLASIILSWILAGVITNVFVNIPLYIKLMGLTKESLANMCSVIPGITADNFMSKYLLFAVVPFNFLLSFIVGLFTVLVYKRLKNVYDLIGNKNK